MALAHVLRHQSESSETLEFIPIATDERMFGEDFQSVTLQPIILHLLSRIDWLGRFAGAAIVHPLKTVDDIASRAITVSRSRGGEACGNPKEAAGHVGARSQILGFAISAGGRGWR